VALRDIFDGDPRSKSQLRDLLSHADKLLSDLSSQLGEIKEKANVSAKEAADLRQKLLAEQKISALSRNASTAEKEESEKRDVRLTQRERTLHTNFEELQRREALLISKEDAATQKSNEENKKLQLNIVNFGRQLVVLQSQLDATKEQLNKKVIELEAQQKKVRDTEDRENAAIKHGFDSVGWAQRRKVEELEQTIKALKYELDVKSLDYKIKIEKLEKSTAAAIKNIDRLQKDEEKNLDKIKRLSEINEKQIEGIGSLKFNVDALKADAKSSAAQINGYISTTSALREEVRRYKEFTDKQAKKLDTSLRLDTPVFMKEEVLAWLFLNTEPDNLQVTGGYLHFMGDGPWENDSFGRLMADQNFSLWKIPDAEIAHLVIGRKNWRDIDLIAQIEARRGQPLRIYSQEMWFAAMATGRDPFDSEDPVLLQVFAKGHEALEFLMGQEMPWPNVSDVPSKNITVVEPGELGVLASPMHLMDYRVGRTSPHSETDRHAILDAIFSARNLPFGEDCSPDYRTNWGAPKSAQRLYRMASHIKFIIDGPNGNDYRKAVARADWINDLSWLKKTYFRKTVHPFKWPTTHIH
jgi:hypothetical protein